MQLYPYFGLQMCNNKCNKKYTYELGIISESEPTILIRPYLSDQKHNASFAVL